MEVSESVVAACLAGEESEAQKLAGTAPETAYFSSKKALSLWVKRHSITPDWAGQGILLNAVAPGIVATPMTFELLESEEGRRLLDRVTPTRLGRPAQPEEIAEVIVFLASVHNSYILGQTVFCDGGAEAILRPDYV
jgi:NAD(P)-dependent dehydrogenase (short-subunit alcohol dehydrogenase family)